MTAAVHDAVHAVDASVVMSLLAVRPRILALGEPTHGEDALLEVRNDLFRQLVEREGYRTIAIESDCLRGLIVDDYVTSGTGALDDVMARGFSHEFGNSPANRELVSWMRAYNDGRPTREQVHFAGFDGPLEITGAASPRQALTELHAYLSARVDAFLLPCTWQTLDQLLGDDDRWPNPAAMMNPGKSVGQTAGAERLRLLTDDLIALLGSQAPPLHANGWERARLYARTAAGLLRYHRWMADSSAARLPQVLSQRALMMAENLLAIAERGPVLAFANNAHLQRDKSSIQMGDSPSRWWSAGAIVSAQLGDDYAVLATALGTIHHRGVDAPPPDTIEGMLYALPEVGYVVDSRRLSAALSATLGDALPPARVSPWFGYAALDPAHLASTDAVVFVKDCPEGKAWWPVG